MNVAPIFYARMQCLDSWQRHLVKIECGKAYHDLLLVNVIVSRTRTDKSVYCRYSQ